MENITVSGKTVNRGYGEPFTSIIEVSLADLKAQLPHGKVKVGDKVWVEGEIDTVKNDGAWVIFPSEKNDKCKRFIFNEEIIAAFPDEQEKENAELPDRVVPDDIGGMNDAINAINMLLKVIKEMKEKADPMTPIERILENFLIGIGVDSRDTIKRYFEKEISEAAQDILALIPEASKCKHEHKEHVEDCISCTVSKIRDSAFAEVRRAMGEEVSDGKV